MPEDKLLFGILNRDNTIHLINLHLTMMTHGREQSLFTTLEEQQSTQVQVYKCIRQTNHSKKRRKLQEESLYEYLTRTTTPTTPITHNRIKVETRGLQTLQRTKVRHLWQVFVIPPPKFPHPSAGLSM
jgi:hypothetical protein